MRRNSRPIPGNSGRPTLPRLDDLDEPFRHNKTAFAIQRLGTAEVNRLKTLAGALNRQVEQAYASPLTLRPVG
jgi:hypothetical protein